MAVPSPHVLSEARKALPFPVARAARTLQLASAPKDQYEALLDAGEALTITIGITAAALLRTRYLGDQELSQLREAYLTRGVAQGVWLDLINRFRRYTAMHSEVLQDAHGALDGNHTRPGIVADLATLLQERNRAAHGGRPRDRHDATERIAQLSPPLERALMNARFLTAVPWVLTESSSYQARTQTFDVTARYAMGDHPEFERRSVTSVTPLPDHTFYAITPDKPIELAPFVVSRYCPECRQEEVFYADRVHKSKGTSLKSFGRGHVIFDHELSEDLQSLS